MSTAKKTITTKKHDASTKMVQSPAVEVRMPAEIVPTYERIHNDNAKMVIVREFQGMLKGIDMSVILNRVKNNQNTAKKLWYSGYGLQELRKFATNPTRCPLESTAKNQSRAFTWMVNLARTCLGMDDLEITTDVIKACTNIIRGEKSTKNVMEQMLPKLPLDNVDKAIEIMQNMFTNPDATELSLHSLDPTPLHLACMLSTQSKWEYKPAQMMFRAYAFMVPKPFSSTTTVRDEGFFVSMIKDIFTDESVLEPYVEWAEKRYKEVAQLTVRTENNPKLQEWLKKDEEHNTAIQELVKICKESKKNAEKVACKRGLAAFWRTRLCGVYAVLVVGKKEVRPAAQPANIAPASAVSPERPPISPETPNLLPEASEVAALVGKDTQIVSANEILNLVTPGPTSTKATPGARLSPATTPYATPLHGRPSVTRISPGTPSGVHSKSPTFQSTSLPVTPSRQIKLVSTSAQKTTLPLKPGSASSPTSPPQIHAPNQFSKSPPSSPRFAVPSTPVAKTPLQPLQKSSLAPTKLASLGSPGNKLPDESPSQKESPKEPGGGKQPAVPEKDATHPSKGEQPGEGKVASPTKHPTVEVQHIPLIVNKPPPEQPLIRIDEGEEGEEEGEEEDNEDEDEGETQRTPSSTAPSCTESPVDSNVVLQPTDPIVSWSEALRHSSVRLSGNEPAPQPAPAPHSPASPKPVASTSLPSDSGSAATVLLSKQTVQETMTLLRRLPKGSVTDVNVNAEALTTEFAHVVSGEGYLCARLAPADESLLWASCLGVELYSPETNSAKFGMFMFGYTIGNMLRVEGDTRYAKVLSFDVFDSTVYVLGLATASETRIQPCVDAYAVPHPLTRGDVQNTIHCWKRLQLAQSDMFDERDTATLPTEKLLAVCAWPEAVCKFVAPFLYCWTPEARHVLYVMQYDLHHTKKLQLDIKTCAVCVTADGIYSARSEISTVIVDFRALPDQTSTSSEWSHTIPVERFRSVKLEAVARRCVLVTVVTDETETLLVLNSSGEDSKIIKATPQRGAGTRYDLVVPVVESDDQPQTFTLNAQEVGGPSGGRLQIGAYITKDNDEKVLMSMLTVDKALVDCGACCTRRGVKRLLYNPSPALRQMVQTYSCGNAAYFVITTLAPHAAGYKSTIHVVALAPASSSSALHSHAIAIPVRAPCKVIGVKPKLVVDANSRFVANETDEMMAYGVPDEIASSLLVDPVTSLFAPLARELLPLTAKCGAIAGFYNQKSMQQLNAMVCNPQAEAQTVDITRAAFSLPPECGCALGKTRADVSAILADAIRSTHVDMKNLVINKVGDVCYTAKAGTILSEDGTNRPIVCQVEQSHVLALDQVEVDLHKCNSYFLAVPSKDNTVSLLGVAFNDDKYTPVLLVSTVQGLDAGYIAPMEYIVSS